MDNQKVNEIIYGAMFGIIEEDQMQSYATEWDAYGEAIEWAKGQKWWKGFLNHLIIETETADGYSMEALNMISDIEQGSHALAGFIESESVDG